LAISQQYSSPRVIHESFFRFFSKQPERPNGRHRVAFAGA
jgi:hypothetical protein